MRLSLGSVTLLCFPKLVAALLSVPSSAAIALIMSDRFTLNGSVSWNPSKGGWSFVRLILLPLLPSFFSFALARAAEIPTSLCFAGAQPSTKLSEARTDAPFHMMIVETSWGTIFATPSSLKVDQFLKRGIVFMLPEAKLYENSKWFGFPLPPSISRYGPADQSLESSRPGELYICGM